MPEIHIGDWKPHKTEKCDVARVNRGRYKFGEIRRYKGAATIYWAKKLPDEVIVNIDAWGVETEILRACKSKMVTHVGIEVTNGDRYLTTLPQFFDHPEAGQLIHPKKGPQRHLPRSAFSVTLAPPETTLELMRLKGRR